MIASFFNVPLFFSVLSTRSGHTVVLITHDLEVAAAAQRVLRMQDGQLLSGATNAVELEASL